MSFDLFVMCFRDGKKATFKREVFEEVFGRNAVDPDLSSGYVKYPDGGGGEIYSRSGDEIGHIMLTHFGGDMMFAAIHELADRTGSAIIWPDTRPSLAVTNAFVVADIPEDCAESIGPAYVAKDHRALMDYIARPNSKCDATG